MNLGGHDLGATIKRLKNVRQLSVTDSLSVILNADPDLFSMLFCFDAFGKKADPALVAPIFDGIGDQVLQAGAYRRHIAEHGREVRINTLFNSATGFFDQFGNVFPDRPQDLRNHKRAKYVLRLSAARRSEQQNAVHEVDQLPRLAGQDGPVKLEVLPPFHITISDVLARGKNSGNRRA